MSPDFAATGRHAPRIVLAVELLLMAVAAMLAALLIWTVVTPQGPVGALPPLPARTHAAPGFAGMDAVFGIRARGGDTVVSDVPLDLYGVRLDRVGGASSAILGGPDEPQRSFRIGEEVLPGITLAEVRDDHAILDRGGARESLYLDQSLPATSVGGSAR